MRMTPRNPVLFVLVLAAIAACLFTGFLSEAPNRLVSGHALILWRVIGEPALVFIAGLGTTLVALSFLKPLESTHIAALTLAIALLLLLCFVAGHCAASLMTGARPATRIALGPGFWIAIFCLAMAALDALQRLNSGPALRAFVVVAVIAGLAAMMAAGVFDQLSIMREYASRREIFVTELIRHGALVLTSCTIAVAIGLPLGILVARRPASGGAIFGTLNLLQTIPSVALFGLLIVPLSALASSVPALGALGIGGIGAAPAIIALVLYSLLPMVRNTHAAITGVDGAIIDAAAGMGLSPAQIFWRVELPLGLPTMIAGLRIMLVQTIGLAVVAALIGAGGLGTFVFQGIGQYATDLVLLGAIPTILLALAADFILTTAVLSLGRKSTP
jgi:osmoprotectant transport system permease protein